VRFTANEPRPCSAPAPTLAPNVAGTRMATTSSFRPRPVAASMLPPQRVVPGPCRSPQSTPACRSRREQPVWPDTASPVRFRTKTRPWMRHRPRSRQPGRQLAGSCPSSPQACAPPAAHRHSRHSGKQQSTCTIGPHPGLPHTARQMHHGAPRHALLSHLAA
jgi:hypothetical protein